MDSTISSLFLNLHPTPHLRGTSFKLPLLMASGILYRTVLTCPRTHPGAPTPVELTSDPHTQTFRYVSIPTFNNNK